MRYCKLIIVILVVFANYPRVVAGEIALIIHPSHKLESISIDLASAIYLGKTKALPDGTMVHPIDLSDDEPSRDLFHRYITRKNKYKYKAHWYRLAFTGKGLPPETVVDDDEMIELISSSKGYIGYVDASALPDDESVKILLTIPTKAI